MESLPENCPMRLLPDLASLLAKKYLEEENGRLFRAAASVEREGYLKWPRLREILELARRLGVRRVGIAFCIGLSEEAEMVSKVFEEWGFQTVSVCCKCGAVDKAEAGLGREVRFREDFDPACNPILQAELLNRAETELNVLLGLCVGHDALFYKYSKAPVTTLAAKDRVTGHNPLAALHTAYLRRLLSPHRSGEASPQAP
ncbi:MAG: metal-binding protein [Candidatus Hecatellales archaeon]|mgnify:CR=1 FL=1|nr:MAG: metal-binding protein [Candidatus Hecatellales archaeon]